MRRRTGNCIPALGPCLLLAACATPFSDRLMEMDWSQQPAPGTITVGKPQMYQRASLINERQEEKEWLKSQLTGSEIATFPPEIAREVEQITAVAAALNYNADPAGALSYRHSSETGEIQQQIDVLKLQGQLDQLKDQMRSGAAASGATGGSGGQGASPSSTGALDTEKLRAQLKELVDRVNTALASRPVANLPAPTGTLAANPAEVFRDRSAYRNVLKAASNAADLDDLHDFAGGALIRMNFQATVLPQAAHSRAPGVVQMTVKEPVLDQHDRERIYKGWLEHINLHLNRPGGSGWTPDADLLNSAAADNFDLLEYRYSLPGTTVRAAGPSKCPGLLLVRAPGNGCGVLTFALPKYGAALPQEKAYVELPDKLPMLQLGRSVEADKEHYDELYKLVRGNATAIVHECVLRGPPERHPGPAFDLYNGVLEALSRTAVAGTLDNIQRAAQRMLALNHIDAPSPEGMVRTISEHAARARQFLATFRQAAFVDCPDDKVQAFEDIAPPMYVPPGFNNVLGVLGGTGRIAVYDIGPREQVRQVSTVSRVANSVAVAVALAATAPRSGKSAQAASDYSRQAAGKAATVERVPGLIGYALPDQSPSYQTFGWIIGPAVTLDPKGDLRLEQTLRPLDLSVDLSVPAWWPWFTIDTVLVWTPSVKSILAGNIKIPGQQPLVMKVPMSTNYADYEALTMRIRRGGLNENRQVSLDEGQLDEQAVHACRPSTVFIRGPSIWRAVSVLVGGYRLEESAIAVAPDMSGILLTVPALASPLLDGRDGKVSISVFTRYREAIGKIRYIAKPAPGGCAAVENETPAEGKPAQLN